MNVEHQLMNKVAEDMAKDIDYQILTDVLKWTKVELLPFESNYDAVDIVDWCHDNCQGKFINFGFKFAFAKAEDAEWFILRWK